MPREKRICASCISDAFLKGEINQSRITDQTCDYCGVIQPTIDMWSLAEKCDRVIENFYEVSSLTDAVIHFGRTPEGKPLPDILDSLLHPPAEVVDDLVELLGDIWFDYSSCEKKYDDDDPWFAEKSSLEAPLSEAWSMMETSLQHEARYLNPTAANLLEEIFGSILDDRTHQGSEVVIHMGAEGEIDTLFRARVFQTPSALIKAFEHPERHLGPPPPGIGAAGRMNAKGVTVFYGATKKSIAVSEVRPPVGSLVVVATFKVVQPLRVLDLRQLGTVSLKPESSLFDPATVKEAARKDFLRKLTQKIVMPVVPELEEHSYVVTQAIADFLATHPKLNLDGILFPSAQHATEDDDQLGSNVILFNKASGVLYSDERNAKRSTAKLYEYNEDSPDGRIDPELWTEERYDNKAMSAWFLPEPERVKPALQLDLASISILEINGVKYEYWPHMVRHVVKKPADKQQIF